MQLTTKIPLQYIQFYPTFKCNLSCTFCFNRGIGSKAEISINDFERIVHIMSDIGVQELDILGGEPTIYPEFSRLIDIAYRNKVKTTISTNGTTVIPQS